MILDYWDGTWVQSQSWCPYKEETEADLTANRRWEDNTVLLQALKTERNHGPGNAALESETGKETD